MDLTISSAHEYENIRMGHMTPAMAADYLREGHLDIRSFGGTLKKFYPASDLQDRLISEFLNDDPSASRVTVSKNVRNWLTDRSRPSSRRTIFHIAFALSLTEAQADFLLGLCTSCGIHYREGDDIIYSWFLRNGRSFVEAERFYTSLPPQPRLTLLPQSYTTGTQLTQEMEQEFLKVHTEDDLRGCYIRNLDNFGMLHLRAYHYFNRFLDQLIHPAAAWGDGREEDYSLDTVMKQYLTLHMPSGKNRKRYSAVQKLIKYNWPNATLLKNIRLRKEDVPRKLLLLLYIATENMVDGEYTEMDEEYVTMEDRLEDHWYGLNAILTDCGMPLLDPRNPFDWTVLYALAVEDDEPMSERMEQVIDTLFAAEDYS